MNTIEHLDVEAKRVFVRVDFNTPLTKGDKPVVSDDSRIVAALPTLRALRQRGANLVIASHLGRPKAVEGGGRDPKCSMDPVAVRLAELLSVDVILADDCIGDGAKKLAKDLRKDQVLLLENLRYNPGEETDDAAFAAELAKLADVYVNDAFGAAHRAHASVHALPKLFRKEQRAAGLLMEKEVKSLSRLLAEHVARPYAAILGGAKVSDKIKVIEALMKRVDVLAIGGAMANTFLKSQGFEIGKSLHEEDKLPLARTLIAKAREQKIKLLLPTDVVVAPSIDAESGETKDVKDVVSSDVILDVGPKSIEAYVGELSFAQNIFWNGPMGLFEKPAFAGGTNSLAQKLSTMRGFRVVGGGDSVAAVEAFKDKFDHVSTGGGASLEMLEGSKLPGISALE